MKFGVKHSLPRFTKHMQMITIVHLIKYKNDQFLIETLDVRNRIS